MASIDLMLERYCRIRSEEASKNGLVIIVAVYGKIIDGKRVRRDLDREGLFCNFLREINLKCC